MYFYQGQCPSRHEYLAIVLQTRASGGLESYQVPGHRFLLEIPECAFSRCVNLLLMMLLAVWVSSSGLSLDWVVHSLRILQP